MPRALLVPGPFFLKLENWICALCMALREKFFFLIKRVMNVSVVVVVVVFVDVVIVVVVLLTSIIL